MTAATTALPRWRRPRTRQPTRRREAAQTGGVDSAEAGPKDQALGRRSRYVAVQRPSRVTPGRFDLAGSRPGGSTNETPRPGLAGRTVTASSVPAPSGSTVAVAIVIGDGPRFGPFDRKTNGWGKRRMARPRSARLTSASNPSSVSARSMPGSMDPTSHIAGPSPSWMTRADRRSGCSSV